MITAKTLLEGPRGRRLLFEFAIISEQNDDDGTHALHEAMSWFSAKNAPASSFILSDTSNDKDPYSSIKSHQKSASVEAVISAMNQVPLAPVTSTRALGALADSVAHAMYWQEPDETDICLADSDMYAPLERIASHICDSKAIAWWSNPVDYNDQWEVRWVEDGQEVSGEPSSVSSQVLKQWERSMQQWETTHKPDLSLPVDQLPGGEWHSTPPFLLHQSSRSILDAPLGLYCEEDGRCLSEARAYRLNVGAYEDKVFEIRSEQDWKYLCQTYPLEVATSRRAVWVPTTGQDLSWVMPNWKQVAADYAGVHLTVEAYLSCAGKALPIGNQASVIAGWNPDTTYWFDSAIRADAEPYSWWRGDDLAGTWHRRATTD